MYVSGSYDLFLQSIFGFLVIAFVFIPFLRWAFSSKAQQAARKEKKRQRKALKRDLNRLKQK